MSKHLGASAASLPFGADASDGVLHGLIDKLAKFGLVLQTLRDVRLGRAAGLFLQQLAHILEQQLLRQGGRHNIAGNFQQHTLAAFLADTADMARSFQCAGRIPCIGAAHIQRMGDIVQTNWPFIMKQEQPVKPRCGGWHAARREQSGHPIDEQAFVIRQALCCNIHYILNITSYRFRPFLSNPVREPKNWRGFMRERYGPWALITGASEGTGREFARLLAEAGIHCLLVARREEALKSLAEELQQEFGVDVRFSAIDLALPDAAARLAKAAEGLEVGLYISNAGADPHSSKFLDKDVALWRDLTQRNVITTLECCHYFGTAMRARGRGGIILVNSGACYNGADYMATYSASKAFQLCLGDALWSELKPHGVDVLNLVLGRTDTPKMRRMLTEKGFPVTPDLAPSSDVARTGLANLANGPVFNWGQDRDGPQLAPMSAEERRKRVEMVSAASKPFFEA